MSATLEIPRDVNQTWAAKVPQPKITEIKADLYVAFCFSLLPRFYQAVIRTMSVGKDRIIRGAPVGPVPDCSLAEYLLPKMRALPRDLPIQIDADTGAVQTVADLLETSIRLSEGLKKLGLRQHDVVGLLSRNCLEADAVVLGSWLSGATVAPTAINVRVAELRHILEVSPPTFVFCEEEAVSTVLSAADVLSTPPVIVLIDVDERRNKEIVKSTRPHRTLKDVLSDTDADSYAPQGVVSPATHLASILYSSGSSGLPKGVAITHRNFVFQGLNLAGVFDFEEMRTCLQISCFFWVTGVLMFLWSLTTGTTRVLVRDTSVPKLMAAIERYKTNWTLMAPSLALAFVDSPHFDSFDLSSMKRLVVGGSPLTSAITDRIRAKWPAIEIMHVYGTTECSGSISSTQEGKELTSVGKVTPGVEVKVADVDTGAGLGAGCLGEICVRSMGIMKGYVKNEEATRAAVDGEGWLHTGDLGYYDEDGRIFIVDRIKEMLKINNFQVAPVELENTILEVPGVAEAAVTGVSPDGHQTLLTALVVKSRGSTVTEEDIHGHIAVTLSEYKKLTGGVHFVDSIPKTNSGKIGRTELKKAAERLYLSSCS